jgi:REP-associated tyrosine transposase
MTVAEAVNKMKSNSSSWMKRQKIKFAWQEGYSSFAVSASLLPKVRQYVLNQEHHHRKMTFEDELMALLRKHGIEAGPKDVFD